MCGIAGILDLTGEGIVPRGAIEAMARALSHRGPDEEGFHVAGGVALASRRLSIVGLADGQQPMTNEDGSVVVVFNGELFDYPERRPELEARGHRFVSHCDTELIPHLWEEHGTELCRRLNGQFAFALWDQTRRLLVLARDRHGICPLYWTRQTRRDPPKGDWLLFASEIKALLASGLVPARADVRGLDHVFHFFSVPAPITCFEGIVGLRPAHFLSVEPGHGRRPARIAAQPYWQIDFPENEAAPDGKAMERHVDELERRLFAAVQRRLRADVPVVSYLSGGVDSSVVVAMASRVLGRPPPTFTIRVRSEKFDESGPAAIVARHVGAQPAVLDFSDADVSRTYPRLIEAAEIPVVDLSSAGLLLLAELVHQHGFKVALTGEGADEWLAGYPWFKVHRWLSLLDGFAGLGQWSRRACLYALGARGRDWDYHRRCQAALGGPSAIHELYGLMALSRRRFYSREMWERLGDYSPYDDFGPLPEQWRRWRPLHRSMYWNARLHLSGNLLSFKADRLAMHSSVEVRYPFLDDDVVEFLAGLHPDCKLRGWREKYVLRRLAERWLPRSIAWRRKQMFCSPYDALCSPHCRLPLEELLSEQALGETGYFDPRAVRRAWERLRGRPRGGLLRTPADMGLAAVVATQLWHRRFLDAGAFAILDTNGAAASERPRILPVISRATA
jgi:asparagine synthase (glutamine-hydrolysing)